MMVVDDYDSFRLLKYYNIWLILEKVRLKFQRERKFLFVE